VREYFIIEIGGSIVNHTMARLWGAGSLLLNPGHLADWLLDRLEELSIALMSAQSELMPCRERVRERRFD
jgi:hypothetical protein